MKSTICFIIPFSFFLGCRPQTGASTTQDSLIVYDTMRFRPEPVLQASLKKDLWAYYNFNGDMKDKSGNGRDITGFNNIQLSYDLFGNNYSALYFNGIDNYAVIEKGREFPESDFSVSFLMISKTLQGEIFHKANLATAQGASFGVGFDDADQDNDTTTNLIYDVCASDNICGSKVTPATFLYAYKQLYADAWYFVTITFARGTQKLYINGKLIRTRKVEKEDIRQCPNATFNIGIWWNEDPLFFSGKIDELRIYCRSLNDEEVQYLSQSARL